MLVAKPGERVRVYFVNAGPNEYSTLHPIAGIWDAVYPSGNPKNKKVGMQSMVVGPGDGATFDIVSPVAGANVIVDHRMSHAHSGAMAVLMRSEEHTSELQSLMRRSSAVFCLKKKTKPNK